MNEQERLMEQPRILITGASGFLGYALMQHFRGRGLVTGVGHRPHRGLESVDLRDLDAWRSFLRAQRPDVVIHAAAYRDPDFCETHREETWRLNVAPVEVLRDTLPAAAQLLFISTDYVFDGRTPPYDETAKRAPINVYGASKQAAEDAALAHARGTVLRVPLLIGAGPTFALSGFVMQLVRAVGADAEVAWDDHTQRYPTAITDVAAALECLMLQQSTGVFHWSGARGQTQYGWACETAERMGVVIPAGWSAVQRPPQRHAERPANSHLSTNRLRGLGFAQHTDFAAVLQQVLDLEQADALV
jgi:dTDP-4-dehydrorhamnose reductase